MRVFALGPWLASQLFHPIHFRFAHTPHTHRIPQRAQVRTDTQTF